MELRFPGAGYGPRAAAARRIMGPSRSRMDQPEPPELLEAETTIERGLASLPNDYKMAPGPRREPICSKATIRRPLKKTKRQENQRPEDMSIKVDLASAY